MPVETRMVAKKVLLQFDRNGHVPLGLHDPLVGTPIRSDVLEKGNRRHARITEGDAIPRTPIRNSTEARRLIEFVEAALKYPAEEYWRRFTREVDGCGQSPRRHLQLSIFECQRIE